MMGVQIRHQTMESQIFKLNVFQLGIPNKKFQQMRETKLAILNQER